MGHSLALFLLGPFAAEHDGQPVDGFESAKTRALLAYLALAAPSAVPRATLTALLWPDLPPHAARHNLSQALFALRQALTATGADDPIEADRQRLAVDPARLRVDAADFAAALARCRHHDHEQEALCADCADRRRSAVERYRGDFLAGLTVDAAAEWDEWVTAQREAYHRQVLDALVWLARYHTWRGEDAAAEATTRRELALEPWREEAHRRLMRLLAGRGQRSAALAQFRLCVEQMATHLGAPPEPATRALADRIAAADGAPVRLPAVPTPLVGRATELADLSARLAHPAYRLLTLVGPGGSGKTRLALAVAERVQARYLDGVFFVGIDSAESTPPAAAAAILRAIAHAVAAPGDTPVHPDRVADHLAARELLLVLDNCDGVLAGAAAVADLLTRAPGVDILATSRARLQVRQEWVVPVGGLPVPVADDPAAVRASPAARLFVQRAHQVDPAFAVDAANAALLAAVCRLVDGVPLALELAAGWVRVLDIPAIAAAISRNLDILATDAPDALPRHRTMRAAFDASWQLLTPGQQRQLRRLATLAGSFDRDAARAVADVGMADLAFLLDHSLLQRRGSHRFALHPLLHQYLLEKAGEDSAEKRAAEHAAARHFAGWLAERETALLDRRQPETLAAVAAELDHLRAAWRVAARDGVTAWPAALLHGLFLFFELRGYHDEGADLLAAAPAGVAGDGVLAAQWLLCRGRLLARLSRHDAARRLLQQAQAAAVAADRLPEQAAAVAYLGEIAWRTGDYPTATDLLTDAVARFDALPDAARSPLQQWRAANALNNLGIVRYEQGDYDAAQTAYEAVLARRRALDDAWGMAAVLNNLGLVAVSQGDWLRARACYEDSLARSEALDNARSAAIARLNLGEIALLQGQPAAATTYLEGSLAAFRRLRNKRGTAFALAFLGHAQHAGGDPTGARARYREALELAAAHDDRARLLDGLAGLAAVLAEERADAAALALAAGVLAHPAAEQATRRRAEAVLARLAGVVSAETIAAAHAAARPDQLADWVQRYAPSAVMSGRASR